MKYTSTKINGAIKVEFQRFGDNRGFFQETLKLSDLKSELGYAPTFKQVNQSKSSAGVVRGIHWADYPPGQAKYLTVQSGAIIDFVVDLRVGSETFGLYDAVHLSAVEPSGIFIGNGIGHAFLSLQDDTVITYLCTEEYNPMREHSINPQDEMVGLPLESLKATYGIAKLHFSEKDINAQSFDQQLLLGRIPVQV